MAIVDRAMALEIANAAGAGDSAKVLELLQAIPGDSTQVHSWAYHAKRLADYIQGDYVGKTPFAVWNVDGNNKLPFASFSVLPIVTCPGASECISYCYSLKAWRYPASFFRQVQNTLLLAHNSDVIAQATYKLAQNTTCRLYVDGDFDSLRTLTFWMLVLRERPDLQTYGYSKSWNLFLMFDRLWASKIGWPKNYLLNLSNGSKFEHLRPKMERLQVTRGNFLALQIDKRLAGKYGHPEYKKALRDAAKAHGLDKVFVCPGKCGTCTKKGHLCGMESATGVNVVIGVH
tara:strand:+ start:2161 stop:3024 length:864 start_codon:yes stop_codon:yes gene_type:complete